MIANPVSVGRRPVPRLALNKPDSADSLGMSVDSLERHVLPHVRVVRRGRLILIPVAELQKWLDANAALTLGDAA